MKLHTATVVLLSSLLASIGSVLAAETLAPRQMLERMSTAMTQMSYQGTFVYWQGDNVETMRITHVSDNKGVRERLVALSGPRREILRDSGGVRWVLADDGSVFQDAAFNRSFFPRLPLDQNDQTERSYTLKLGDEERIAGHLARNLEVLPRDKYRYGYSLWLEQHSGLLLKWELIDSDRKTLARLMFTEVSMGSEVDVKELEPTRNLKKFKTIGSTLPAGRGLSSTEPKWRPSSVPPGFELTAHRFLNEQDQGMYEHLVYSDGLAAVSVYIESERPGSAKRDGVKRLGTTHAFSRSSEDMLITVIGDVPAATVKAIGDAVVIELP